MSRAAMYLANNIQDMKLIACLILPASLVNRGADGPTLTRILEKRREGDNRPDYALKGKTMAVALESIYHAELDDMPNVSRGRTSRQEWFKTTQSNFQNIKLALQAVGQGVFYDFTKFSPTAMPSEFIGKGTKLEGGQTLATTTHTFRESPRLQELRKALQAGDEVEGEDGIIRLDASDIFDIRRGTQRGLQLLELITQKEKAAATTQTATTPTTTTTAAAQTPVAPPPQRTTATQAPLNVRMTRSAVRALRTADTTEDEQRRRRIARALAALA